MKNFLLIGCLWLCSYYSFSQASIRKLPTSINHPAINVSTPYMSFDGDALLFLSDNAEDYVLTPFFTYRENNGDWKEPAKLPAQIHNKLSYLGGFTLDTEGKSLYYTTIKSPGVGGFDIWTAQRSGASWGAPKNLGAPINSKGNEASATVTPDGKMMYFMRCDKMDQKSASGCKIMVARKNKLGQWDEPEELPATINTGNSQTPRIMADSETLIFSSDQFGGKGGMDLFVSRYQDGQWSTPKPLEFVNTEKNDQYISVNGLGRYLLRDSPGARKSELVEYLIPKGLRPKGVMRVDGKVTDVSGGTISSYLSVMDLTTNTRVFNGRPAADGSFTVYLLEGSKYRLSVDPEKSNVSFYTKDFDLMKEDIPQFEKIKVTLKEVQSGDELNLNQVSFKPNSSELEPSSYNELKQLARVIKSSPGMKFEIQVMLIGYEEDTVRTSVDLTEMVYDSVHLIVDEIDSLGQLYQRDSIFTRISYHNDRTQKQAQAVIGYLGSEGITEENLSFLVNARPEAVEEKRKTVIKARAYR